MRPLEHRVHELLPDIFFGCIEYEVIKRVLLEIRSPRRLERLKRDAVVLERRTPCDCLLVQLMRLRVVPRQTVCVELVHCRRD